MFHTAQEDMLIKVALRVNLRQKKNLKRKK
nr:MAG TPA: hypothetical protein [Caudoviricetes sp.]